MYRYELHRTWDIDKGEVLFIMLNPSTANAWKDDLTTIRCINFAKKWGYGGISIGNIYPFRAKRPKNLRKWLKEHNGVGMANWENEDHVRRMANEADIIVCAWGCNYKEGIPEWIDELGVPFESELNLMVVHGILHILGWDHQTDAEAEVMETREAEHLAVIGQVRR